MERAIPKEIRKRAKAWKFFYIWWYSLHYFLNVVSIISPLIVAYMAFEISNLKILAILSLVAATSAALNLFLMPYKRAKGYVRAWRDLSSSILDYETDERVNIKVLLKAIRSGENKIANQYE